MVLKNVCLKNATDILMFICPRGCFSLSHAYKLMYKFNEKSPWMANLNKIKKKYSHNWAAAATKKRNINLWKLNNFVMDSKAIFFRMFARLIKNNKSIPEKEQKFRVEEKFLYLCANVKYWGHTNSDIFIFEASFVYHVKKWWSLVWLKKYWNIYDSPGKWNLFYLWNSINSLQCIVLWHCKENKYGNERP